jgi:MoaA/NifB/PqqE/SkfB family radical SAM enzyme
MIEELAKMGTREITISASGEPATHPDLVKIARAVKHARMDLKIITNLSVHSTRAIAAYRLADHLMINLTAADSHDYADIHKPQGANPFDKIITNIRILKHSSIKHKHPHLTLGYVITRHTYNKIPGFIAMARSIGITSIRFKTMDPTPSNRKLALTRQDSRKLRDATPALIAKTPVGLTNLDEIQKELSPKCPERNRSHGHCLVTSIVMDIAENGSVSLCCQNTKLVIGDARKNSLRDIWNNKKAMHIRMASKKGMDFKEPLWAACQSCAYAQRSKYITNLSRML